MFRRAGAERHGETIRRAGAERLGETIRRAGAERLGEMFRRKPRLRDVGTDPDYRFTLANERTFLAWLRTGLGLLAGAVALSGLVHNFGPRPMRLGITALLLTLSFAVTTGAYWRWDRAERAMREQRPLPYDPLPRLLIAGLAIVILAAAVLIYLAEAR